MSEIAMLRQLQVAQLQSGSEAAVKWLDSTLNGARALKIRCSVRQRTHDLEAEKDHQLRFDCVPAFGSRVFP
jgi:hypothetical protein